MILEARLVMPYENRFGMEDEEVDLDLNELYEIEYKEEREEDNHISSNTRHVVGKLYCFDHMELMFDCSTIGNSRRIHLEPEDIIKIRPYVEADK